MALINCPNCNSRISEYAETCPKCKINVAILLKEKEKTDKINKIRSKIKESLKKEHFLKVNKLLNELLNLDSDNQSIREEINEVEKLINNKSIEVDLQIAQDKFNEKDYRKCISYCDEVLSLQPKNSVAIALIKEAQNIQEKNKKRVISYSIISIIVLFVVSAITIFFLNQIYIFQSKINLENNKYNEARKELDNCFSFFAFGKAALHKEINIEEFNFILSNSDIYIPKPNRGKSNKLKESFEKEDSRKYLDELINLIWKDYFPFKRMPVSNKPIYSFQWGIHPKDILNYLKKYGSFAPFQHHLGYIYDSRPKDDNLKKILNYKLFHEISKNFDLEYRFFKKNSDIEGKLSKRFSIKEDFLQENISSVVLWFYDDKYYYVDITYNADKVNILDIVELFKKEYGKRLNEWVTSGYPPSSNLSWFDGKTYLCLTYKLPDSKFMKAGYTRKKLSVFAVDTKQMNDIYKDVYNKFLNFK